MIDKKKTFRYMLIGHLFFWGTFGLFMAILAPMGIGSVTINGEVQEGWDVFKWALIIAVLGGVIMAVLNYFMIEAGHRIKELLMFWKKKDKTEKVEEDKDVNPPKNPQKPLE